MANVIRIGDPTSHDGKVVESGAPHFTVSGKAVAFSREGVNNIV